MGWGVGLSYPSLQLTFSRRWAAVCANKRGREPGGPGAAPAPTPRTQGRTHRNLVCWSLCEPAICLYTSFSCQARAGMRLGPRGTQFPETCPSWLPPAPHLWARPWPHPCQEPLRGNGSPETPLQGHVQGGPCPTGTSRSHGACPGLSPHQVSPRPGAAAALTFSSTSWRSWSHSRVSGFSRFSVQRRARRRDSP